jgi:hypothetical protein
MIKRGFIWWNINYVQSRPSKSERLLAKIFVFFVRLNQAVFIGVRAAGVTILIIKSCNNKNETKK